MKIPPVSKSRPELPVQELKQHVASPSLGPTSSLCSMQRPCFFSSIGEQITRIFSAVFRFIRSIFCCFSTESPTVNPPDVKSIPKIDLNHLPEQDPFLKLVFVINSDGSTTLRSKKKFELATKIFQTLGGGGPLHWLQHKAQLEHWEKEIEKMPGDPLEFLYFLFHDRSMTSSMNGFKQNANSNFARACSLVARRPWEEFLAKQSLGFELRRNKEMLPGFCSALGLSQPALSPLFENKKWEDLIHYVLEERKKHFSINTQTT